MCDYKNKLSTTREKTSTIKRNAKIAEYYSDRSRIVYCSSFRRLQQKAQVFSLEPNASVRTRLTHSLEVSDLGRTLANKIAYKLANKKHLSVSNIRNVVAVVENACLLHDIGNPPFGHFGESAIRDWANNRALDSLPAGMDKDKDDDQLNMLMSDFKEFNGNPQGFRIITKLYTERDEFSLNLTYATLLCTLKYSRASGETADDGTCKKAGYFQSEKELVEKIFKSVEVEPHTRYPLTYIMEAADDIAYCMSDISDGIEKQILTEETFLREFKKEFDNVYHEKKLPIRIPATDELCSFNLDISIPWAKAAMEEAVESYFSKHAEIYAGTAKSLIEKNSPMGCVLETMKCVSKKILYTSVEAESIELTGYAVITGIIERYEKLLKLDFATFEKLINKEKTENVDVERRLFNRIGDRYISAYNFAINKLDRENIDFKIIEWWLRVHLLIDHISGMTDEFALETYQMLEGIKLMRT